MSDFSRRTVVRGTAWTVPVIAVAAQAPAFAVSPPPPPPPPVINFGGACANTGATQKGCGSDKSLQVPLTLSNPGSTDYTFQITSMYTCNNCGAAPTAAGAGVYSGIGGIFKTPDHTVPSQNDCNVKNSGPCTSGGLSGGSVLVPAGTVVPQTFWIVSVSTGASSSFQSTINWRLLDANCNVISTGQAQTAVAISPANCDGR